MNAKPFAKSPFLIVSLLIGLTSSTMLGQTDRTFTGGGANPAWALIGNWSGANVPSTTAERAVFNGSNNSWTLANLSGNSYEIGSIQIINPATAIAISNNNPTLAAILTVTPTTSYGGVGVDMSTALKDFSFAAGASLWTYQLGSSQSWNVTGSGNLSVASSGVIVNLQGFTLTTNAGTGRTISMAGLINGAAGGAITKTGVGALTISGAANTYTGKTTVANGTLSFSTGNASATSNQSLGTNTALDLGVASTSSGILNYTGAAGTLAKTVNVLGNGADTIQNSGSGLLTLSGGIAKNGTTLTLKGGANGIDVTGVISGASGSSDLIIDGGTTTLSNANTYAGTTWLTSGTLIVNGNQSAANGAVSVSAGATLGGTGTIGGATTISGTHNPGNSPGIQTFVSNLAYTGGASAVNWELKTNTTNNAPNPNALFDTIIVGGNLNFADATTLNLSFVPIGSDVLWGNSLWDASITGTNGWLLYDVAGMTTNFGNLSLGSIDWSDSAGGLFKTIRPNSNFSLFLDGNDIYLNYNAVPEPSSFVMLLMGFGVLIAFQRSCRRA